MREILLSDMDTDSREKVMALLAMQPPASCPSLTPGASSYLETLTLSDYSPLTATLALFEKGSDVAWIVRSSEGILEMATQNALPTHDLAFQYFVHTYGVDSLAQHNYAAYLVGLRMHSHRLSLPRMMQCLLADGTIFTTTDWSLLCFITRKTLPMTLMDSTTHIRTLHVDQAIQILRATFPKVVLQGVRDWMAANPSSGQRVDMYSMAMTTIGVARRAFQPRMCEVEGLHPFADLSLGSVSPVGRTTEYARKRLSHEERELLEGLEAALLEGVEGRRPPFCDEEGMLEGSLTRSGGRTSLERLADGL